MSASGCQASFLSQLFSGNAIICSQTFQDYEVADTVQQQVDTLQNVATYTPDALGVAAASTAAAIEAAPSEVSSITNGLANNPSCSGLDFSFIGGPCISTTVIWISVGVLALLLLVIFLGDIRAIIGR